MWHGIRAIPHFRPDCVATVHVMPESRHTPPLRDEYRTAVMETLWYLLRSISTMFGRPLAIHGIEPASASAIYGQHFLQAHLLLTVDTSIPLE